MERTPKPIGRPPLAPHEGKKYPLAIRSTRELKAALVKASQASGRSLAQEIERRLEQSLDDQRHLAAALELGFGRQTAGVMLLIGCVIKYVLPDNRRAPRGAGLWDPPAFATAAASIKALLEVLCPDGDPAQWTRAVEHNDEAMINALGTLLPIVFPDAGYFDDDVAVWSPAIRDWLGEAVIARLKEGLEPALSRPSPEQSPKSR